MELRKSNRNLTRIILEAYLKTLCKYKKKYVRREIIQRYMDGYNFTSINGIKHLEKGIYDVYCITPRRNLVEYRCKWDGCCFLLKAKSELIDTVVAYKFAY